MSMRRLIKVLDDLGLEPTYREVAEALWLARHLGGPTGGSTVRVTRPAKQEAAEPEGWPAPYRPPAEDGRGVDGRDGNEVGDDWRYGLYSNGLTEERPSTEARGHNIRVPAVSALPDQLELIRQLRAFKRRLVAGRTQQLDEEGTVAWIARTQVWRPVFRPVPERWFDVVLLVDTGASMVIWKALVSELASLLQCLGAFRDVRVRYLHSTEDGEVSQSSSDRRDSTRLRPLPELLDPAGRRVVIVVSDCVGEGWDSGVIGRGLAELSRSGPVSVFQPLPQHLWRRTGVRPVSGRMSAATFGRGRRRFRFRARRSLADRRRSTRATSIPVLQLGPEWLGPWARLVAGRGSATMDCAVLGLPATRPSTSPVQRQRRYLPASPLERVWSFRAAASPEAFQLATYLSAVPLDLSVIRLVQRVMMPESRPFHLSEVLTGGLVTLSSAMPAEESAVPVGPTTDVHYQFLPGVREVLLSMLSRSGQQAVLEALSHFLEDHFGISPREFSATLAMPGRPQNGQRVFGSPFAYVSVSVLRRVHGQLATSLRGENPSSLRHDRDHHRALLEQAEDALASFRRSGTSDELDKAITAFRDSLQFFALDRNGRFRSLVGLAGGLLLRYQRFGRACSLDESIRFYQEALRVGGGREQDEATLLHRLSTALFARYTLSQIPDYLDDAARAGRSALDATPEDDSRARVYRESLADVLHRRFLLIGELGELAEAATLYRAVLEDLDPEGPAHADVLAKLAGVLGDQAESTGLETDLADSYDAWRRAARATRPGEQEYPKRLFTAGRFAMRLRYFESAIDLLSDAAGAFAQLLGPEAEETLRCRIYRARSLYQSGERSAGVGELTEVLEIRVRLLGTNHPETEEIRRELGELV
ncbi:SAV_2336 N-terminal domain-related protein [Actinoalloteichus caeruleus]|uniref:SAV_2336 N-terminal domain-related protein n=1 Tax=Actinoalloteichus cyanogriseus TaxID=2893586 RepID=UPI003BB957ED